MDITSKIECRAAGILAALEYLNRSKKAQERSKRPVAMIPSWGLVKRLGEASERKGWVSQIAERLMIGEVIAL